MKTEAEGYKLTTLSISDMYAAMAIPGIHHDLSCDTRNTGSIPVTCTLITRNSLYCKVF